MVRKKTWYNIPREGSRRMFGGQPFYFHGYITNKLDLEDEKDSLKRKNYNVRILKKERPKRYEIYKKSR